MASRPASGTQDEIDDRYYDNILVATNELYSEREVLAIEFAERYGLDHESMDDAFFDRLREHFSEDEILDLTVCAGRYLGFGRLTQVLQL